MSERPTAKMQLGDLYPEEGLAAQLRLARFLLGCAINAARGTGHLRAASAHPEHRLKYVKQIEDAGVEYGLILFDDFHHAPCCPANHYHHMVMPTAPCSCGANPNG